MPLEALITPLRPGMYYHVYNRGNNREKLFYYQGDYGFFLKKYYQYLGNYILTYGYCLVPNHFHFLIQIKEDIEDGSGIVSNQFRKLFISHAKRVNVREGRTGSLLTKNFRRIEIKDERYFKNLLMYIHFNPIRHGINTNFIDYQFSSFKLILTGQLPGISCDQIYHWYGSKDEYLEKHLLSVDDPRILHLIKEI